MTGGEALDVYLHGKTWYDTHYHNCVKVKYMKGFGYVVIPYEEEAKKAKTIFTKSSGYREGWIPPNTEHPC